MCPVRHFARKMPKTPAHLLARKSRFRSEVSSEHLKPLEERRLHYQSHQMELLPDLFLRLVSTQSSAKFSTSHSSTWQTPFKYCKEHLNIVRLPLRCTLYPISSTKDTESDHK